MIQEFKTSRTEKANYIEAKLNARHLKNSGDDKLLKI